MNVNIPECYYRISIKALIMNDENKFLLVKEDNGRWELPGGGLEFGETPEECIRRELNEEMGLTVTEVAKNPSYFLSMKHEKYDHIVNVLFETKVKDLNFIPSNECIEIRFFSNKEALEETNVFRNVHIFAEMFK